MKQLVSLTDIECQHLQVSVHRGIANARRKLERLYPVREPTTEGMKKWQETDHLPSLST
jgi:hypothetical protein